MTTGREARCTYAGREYVIPEIWLAGFQTVNRCTMLEAVAYWAWQSDLEASATTSERM